MTFCRRTNSWNIGTPIAGFLTIIVMLATMAMARAQSINPVPPPLSVPKALYFKNNPDAWSHFLSELPRRPDSPQEINPQPTSPPFGGTWSAVTAAPSSGLGNPLLLLDGTVIVHVSESQEWFKLTPTIVGSYVNGTWSKIASLPGGYGPLYFASAVLSNGEVVMQGGEYNQSCSNSEAWTSLGAIYNPATNTWKSVAHPSGSGWENTEQCTGSANGGVGDAASIVLPDNTFMLSACCAFPAVDALLSVSTLAYTATGAPIDPCVPCGGGTYQDEQGYTLLHSGAILTIDVWDSPKAEQYNPATGHWTDIASLPVSLVDPSACGNFEIGPALTRADGTVVGFGGNSGCTGTADPTAIYNPNNNTWAKGPNVPTVGGKHFSLADAPAALLPNGNILFASSPGYGNAPTHFFEFTSATSSPADSIAQVADPLFFASSSPDYYYNLLVLPTGQILMTDFSNRPEVYTPVGRPAPAWAPTITSAPNCVVRGETYTLGGKQLNGLSQGAAYGDDVQGATNYPLVKIRNNSTGHVFFARTGDFANRSIAVGAAGSTEFVPATTTELGASVLYVVANGISSVGKAVTVGTSCSAKAAALN